MLERSRSILSVEREVWPLASRWFCALEKAYQASDAKWAEEHGCVGDISPQPQLARLTSTQRDSIRPALPGPTTLLATNNLPSPTLPPLALPETSQRFFPPGPPHMLHMPPRSQTAGLPPIYPPSHPSPPGTDFGSGHPITPQSAHEAFDMGRALGPESDGFEAELRFYLRGEEAGRFGFL